jgi:hypothetical protein
VVPECSSNEGWAVAFNIVEGSLVDMGEGAGFSGQNSEVKDMCSEL